MILSTSWSPANDSPLFTSLSQDPFKLPRHGTYLVELVGVVIAALKLLVKHTVLLCEDLYHLLGSLHNRKGIWSKLLAGGGWWGLCSRQAHGERKRQGDRVQRTTDGGGLRGHGAMLLHRGWKRQLAGAAVKEERTSQLSDSRGHREGGRPPTQALSVASLSRGQPYTPSHFAKRQV